MYDVLENAVVSAFTSVGGGSKHSDRSDYP